MWGPGPAAGRTSVPWPRPRFRGVVAASLLLELTLVDLVLRNLVRDAAARQPAEVGALADLSARLVQRLAQVLLLEGGGQLCQLLRQRPRQVHAPGARLRHSRRAEDVGWQVRGLDHAV